MKPQALAIAALSVLGASAVALPATAYATSPASLTSPAIGAHAADTAHTARATRSAPIAPAARADAVTYYVATNGSDSASGTTATPFATIQHAITALTALPSGGTVVVRGGTYAQRISLHNVHDITVTAATGEHPVLDGKTLTVPTGRSAMVDIADSTSVTVHGLDITGYRTKDISGMPIGIYVHGGDTGVTISGNRVHHMGNDNGTLGSMDMNAHGIAAYGDDPKQSISTLSIDHNEVDDLVLGASESVVVNGNVDGWSITGNQIHDNNNIGIDAIGFEPTLPPAYRYTDLNRARNGVISGNTVTNIKSAGNPAYWSSGGWCNCADGLYVDGGTHIDIAGNTAQADDIGIEVAAENARGAADHVTVEHNTVSDSRYVGITTGGYCDGQQDCGGVQTGTSSSNTFTGNVLRNNNTDHDGSPEFLIQFHESGNTITGNTICAAGPGTLLIGTVARSTSGKGDTVDDNRYSAAAASATTAQWGWHGTTYTGFAAYRAATGLDAHSAFSASC